MMIFTLLITISIFWNSYSQQENCYDIKRSDDDIPSDYYLGKVSPQPHNYLYYFEFGVPDSSKVNFNAYDILGRKIGNTVDCLITGGNYKLYWETFFRDIEYSSGVYFIKMNAVLLSEKNIDDSNFNSRTKIIVVK